MLQFVKNLLSKGKSTKVIVPVLAIEAPSAKVYRVSNIIGFPALRELYIEGDPKG